MSRNDNNAGVFSDQDVIGANQKLLDAIAAGDYATYSDLTAADLTAIEPESRGHPVHGLAFHKYYFDLYSHPAMTTATPRRQEAQPLITTVISMSNPHVRWLGGGCCSDGCGEGTAAVITYVRLDQTMSVGDAAEGGGPTTKTMSETRVWENRDGKLINVHFHKS